jgi:ketosteroid isomerase-like protein
VRGKAVNPEEIVPAELSAWARRDVDEILGHFAADAVWDNAWRDYFDAP